MRLPLTKTETALATSGIFFAVMGAISFAQGNVDGWTLRWLIAAACFITAAAPWKWAK